MKKPQILWIAAVLVFAGIGYLIEQSGSSTMRVSSGPATPSIPAGDKQIFEVMVKEGYQPHEITAKAGVPVLLKMKTQGTFDCSNVFTIPKLGIRAQLQPTGEASIDIPAQKAGDSVYGVCGMGMYSLVIKFT